MRDRSDRRRTGSERRPSQRFETGHDAALALRPDVPVYCFRPDVLTADARAFMAAFPGKTAYAVKTNGEAFVLQDAGRGRHPRLRRREPGRVRRRARRLAGRRAPLHASGQGAVRHPAGAGALRHPRASRSTTRTRSPRSCASSARSTSTPPRSRSSCGCRRKGPAAYELSQKVRRGARAMRWSCCERIDRIGFRAGICFHVGSQIEDPEIYERALASADWVRNRAGVPLAGLDVGGGFPASYGHDPRRTQAGDAGPRRADGGAPQRHRRMGLFRPAADRRARPRHRRALALGDRARAPEEGQAALHQ